ncbi:MAG: radical SAM protein [Deltaproteobacteria bacterium]|nr:radical SAM protein [Deltaproteobacteria bacterium]
MGKLFLDGSKLFHHLDELIKWKKNEAFFPVHVEISPTNACNYRCTFCYADFTGHEKRKIEKEILIRLMNDMGQKGVKSCLFAGDGEPTLVKYVMDAIRTGKEAGIDMALNSNGKLFNEEWAENTLPYLTWLRFSVMAATPEIYSQVHGTRKEDWSRTIGNISKAVEVKRKHNLPVTIGIQQVLLPENAHEVAELARISKEMGVDYYVLKPFSLHQGNTAYQDGISAVALRDRHLDILKKAEDLTNDAFTCIIRWNTFLDDGVPSYERCLGLPFIAQIAADAKIYTCCPFFYHDEFAYGDLHKEGFADIWMGQRADRMRRQMAEQFDVQHNCMSYCRHHQINILLWKLANPPAHINFI